MKIRVKTLECLRNDPDVKDWIGEFEKISKQDTRFQFIKYTGKIIDTDNGKPSEECDVFLYRVNNGDKIADWCVEEIIPE